MYRLMQPSDKAAVLALWQRERGESEEFAANAVERFAGQQNVYVAEENDAIAAVALAVPVTLQGRQGSYLYGLCGQGSLILAGLLDYLCAQQKLRGAGFTVAVPATPEQAALLQDKGFARAFALRCLPREVARNLCSQMEDMSSIEFMMELRKLEHKPLLMLFDEGRRKNSSALRMEDSGSCCCVERMELKNLLRELYRMPGQQWQRTEQQCQQLYHSWGIRIPDINCSYLTSAVGVVYGTSQKLAIRKEILQAVSEQYGVSVSAVDSGIRRTIDQLEAKPAEGWTQFKAESGFEAEKPTTGKLIYAIKRYLIQQKSRE